MSCKYPICPVIYVVAKQKIILINNILISLNDWSQTGPKLGHTVIQSFDERMITFPGVTITPKSVDSKVVGGDDRVNSTFGQGKAW